MADVKGMMPWWERTSNQLGTQGQFATYGTQGVQQTPYWQSEMGLMNQLMGMASGTSGPSAAQSLFQQSLDRAQKGAMSAAVSTRGINPVAAARVGADAGANIAGEGAAQAAMLRAQEQQQAIAMLQALQGQMGGQYAQAFELGQLAPWQTLTQGQAGIKAAKASQPEWWQQLLGMPGQAVGGLMQGVGGAMVSGGGAGG
jgi:hypothetical protein